MELATIIAHAYPKEKRRTALDSVQALLDFVNEGEADYLERHADKIRNLGALFARHGFQEYSFEYELAKTALMAFYERQEHYTGGVERLAALGLLANPDNSPEIAARMLNKGNEGAIRSIGVTIDVLPELTPLFEAYLFVRREMTEKALPAFHQVITAK